MRHFGAIPDENPSLSDKNTFIGRSLCDRVSMKGLSMADDILLLGGQSATPVKGRANRKNPFYSAWNLFKLGFTAFGDPTCRVTKLHFMSSRALILHIAVSITPDDKNKHR
ncbi:hypothetical protein AVEN_9805-1 [Araneus ventricosus]|uniref:Uncharacterized protein n=1 Tax=Araneus ventricosus TaxID=182803 RepID=A0A4Y2ESP5_ARAVE|nr:hypothetical protein AVEN_9805-1 [Araneus ventricosus]